MKTKKKTAEELLRDLFIVDNTNFTEEVINSWEWEVETGKAYTKFTYGKYTFLIQNAKNMIKFQRDGTYKLVMKAKLTEVSKCYHMELLVNLVNKMNAENSIW